jgi:hypothetical protein
VDIGPTPEMREACRRVLRSDNPETVINAMREPGGFRWRRVEEIHAEILEPKRKGEA